VKTHVLDQARTIFQNTGINIVGGGDQGGQRDLGIAIGSPEFVTKFLRSKVAKWMELVDVLSTFAVSQPHAAHAAFVHGLQGRWFYSQSTMQQIAELLQPLEDKIRSKFIPSLIGDGMPISDTERDLWALPTRYGGMGIENPMREASHKRQECLETTEQLKNLIKSSDRDSKVCEQDQKNLKAAVRKTREARKKTEAQRIRAALSPEMQRAMDVAQERGASAVFSAMPLQKFGFVFPMKRDFRDLICMRYRKPIPRLPSVCACGSPYSLDHSQVCQKGGFIHMRHDEPKMLWAKKAKLVFNDVEVEPWLEPLCGEEIESKRAKLGDDVRSDVRIRGFWGNRQQAFFEFRVLYPFASSYLSAEPEALYTRFAKIRKAEYAERINRVDSGSFTPMIMSSSGGMGPEMSAAVKHMAMLIAERRGETYSQVAGFLRCEFSFAMMRSALICLRGSRSVKPRELTLEDTPVDVVMQELRL
jgi:hypothetical protein